MRNYMQRIFPLFFGLLIICVSGCSPESELESLPVSYGLAPIVPVVPDVNTETTQPAEAIDAQRIILCNLDYDAIEKLETEEPVQFGNFPAKTIKKVDRYTVPSTKDVYGKLPPTYEEILRLHQPLYPDAVVDTIINIKRYGCRWVRPKKA